VLLPVCSTVRCNRPRHDPCKAARNVLILLCRLNACKDLLDTNTNLLTASALFDFRDRALDIIKRTRFLQNVCELALGIDIWYRDLGIEAAEEV
jgi:hypothetical protein